MFLNDFPKTPDRKRQKPKKNTKNTKTKRSFELCPKNSYLLSSRDHVFYITASVHYSSCFFHGMIFFWCKKQFVGCVDDAFWVWVVLGCVPGEICPVGGWKVKKNWERFIGYVSKKINDRTGSCRMVWMCGCRDSCREWVEQVSFLCRVAFDCKHKFYAKWQACLGWYG